jgi:hypothetical protein
VGGGEKTVRPAERIGDGRGAVDSEPAVELADSGAGVVAWRARSRTVAVEERPVEGDNGIRGVSSSSVGPVGDIDIAGSRIGDAVVAYLQGDPDSKQIAAAIVDAPPLDFAVQTPISYVKSRRPHITWDAAENALTPVTYSVKVDGRTVARRLTGRGYRIRKKLRDGRRDVTVTATDGAGQGTTSEPSLLKVDRHSPRARVHVRGRKLRVTLVDGNRRRSSGVSHTGAVISFGDGRRARRKSKARHTYKRAGSYTVVIKARDRAGNRIRVKRRVSVR